MIWRRGSAPGGPHPLEPVVTFTSARFRNAFYRLNDRALSYRPGTPLALNDKSIIVSARDPVGFSASKQQWQGGKSILVSAGDPVGMPDRIECRAAVKAEMSGR
jgi:hypothetical protein